MQQVVLSRADRQTDRERSSAVIETSVKLWEAQRDQMQILKKTVTTVVRPKWGYRFQHLQSSTSHFRTEGYFFQVELFRIDPKGQFKNCVIFASRHKSQKPKSIQRRVRSTIHITQLKLQKWKRWYFSATHRHYVNVVHSNTTGSFLYLCTTVEAESLIGSKVMRVPKFEYCVTWSGARRLRVVLWSVYVWGSVLYVSTKFEADSSIRSKFIGLKGSQKFKIGSLDLGHSHLWLFCGPYAGRCVIYLRSEIKADSLTRSKVISGSQNLEIGSRDPNPPPFLTLNFELL